MRWAAVVVAAAMLPVAAIGAAPSPAAAAMSATNMAFLNTNPGGYWNPETGVYAGYASAGGLEFYDSDLPPALSAISVRVSTSSDPIGILVLAWRNARNDPEYKASFSFSPSASSPTAAVVKVADGDSVTASYADATDDTGQPRVETITTTWHGVSRTPDFRQMVYSTANPGRPTLTGAPTSVPGGTPIAVYASVSATQPLATANAGVDGSFSAELPATSPVLDEVWVADTEPTLAVSARQDVRRAGITARVVAGGTGAEPLEGWSLRATAEGRTDGCPASWQSCDLGSELSEANGTVYAVDASIGAYPGTYDVTVPREYSHYGPADSTVKATVTSYDQTVDVGTFTMAGPNLAFRVDGPGGLPIDQAMLFDSQAGGPERPYDVTARDGTLSTFLDDGTYDFSARTPYGTPTVETAPQHVVVSGGHASPSTLSFSLPYAPAVTDVTIPLSTDGAGPLSVHLADPAPIDVTFEHPTGTGQLAAHLRTGPPTGVQGAAATIGLSSVGVSYDAVDICMTYDSASTPSGVDPSLLQLFAAGPTATPTPITTRVDTATNRVCGRAGTLGNDFAIGVANQSPVPARSGYWLLGATGAVFGFGDAQPLGDHPAPGAANIAASPTGNGYWVVDRAGGVSVHGDARSFGGSPPLARDEVVTSLSPTPAGDGYWIFTNRGRVFAFGAAPFLGDMSAARLNGPVLGSVATPSGHGYYMVASDGGVFAFGDAHFSGSMGAAHLNKPVEGIAPNPSGTGYWLVASDGGVFAFDAPFRGSMGSSNLNQPIAAMIAYGDGYLLVGGDGGTFDFSNQPFRGSLGANPPPSPIIAVASLPR